MKILNIMIAFTILTFLGLAMTQAYVSSGSCHDDMCRGKKFAIDNQLKSPDECKYLNKPYFDTDASNETMKGCQKYFEVNQ